MSEDASLRSIFQYYASNVTKQKFEHSSPLKAHYRMSRKQFLIFSEELPGLLSPIGNLRDECCCVGKPLSINTVDLIFSSVSGAHEQTINFLSFCKSLVYLSMKLYPRSDASLSFALFLAEILYSLPFVPVNARARAQAHASILLADHTLRNARSSDCHAGFATLNTSDRRSTFGTSRVCNNVRANHGTLEPLEFKSNVTSSRPIIIEDLQVHEDK